MKFKCFFCKHYTINIKFHIKRCEKFRQISDDVFYNCILSLVRLDKLKDRINKKTNILFRRNHVIAILLTVTNQSSLHKVGLHKCAVMTNLY